MVIELSSESEAGTPVKPKPKRVKKEFSIKRYDTYGKCPHSWDQPSAWVGGCMGVCVGGGGFKPCILASYPGPPPTQTLKKKKEGLVSIVCACANRAVYRHFAQWG